MKLLHFSDLHIHRSAEKNQLVTALFDRVGTMFPDHYIVVTGDITDDGHEKQYEQAQRMLLPFKGRVFLCPGNHDFGATGNFFSRERAVRFDDYLAGPLEQGGRFYGSQEPVVNVIEDGVTKCMLIALDTNLETTHPFDFACGEVGERQLSALQSIMASPGANEMVKVLFFHHHLFMQNDPFMELKDARELSQCIYNSVDVVLFGHKHESRQWVNMLGTSYVLAADNSPGKAFAREIEIQGRNITVRDVSIS